MRNGFEKEKEGTMRTRTTLASLAVFFAGIALCLAADSQMGTWKLNEGMSKIAPGMPKNVTVVYAPMGDKVKVTVDGVDKDGNPTHNEWIGKFDGKFYAVTGDPMSDMRSYTVLSDSKMSIVVKKSGKMTLTGEVVLAPGGKSRTLTINAAHPDPTSGKRVASIAVYDKQ